MATAAVAPTFHPAVRTAQKAAKSKKTVAGKAHAIDTTLKYTLKVAAIAAARAALVTDGGHASVIAQLDAAT